MPQTNPTGQPRGRAVLTRRGFLQTGSAMIGLGITHLPSAGATGWNRARVATGCIQINLVGGPSQLDTWDPKPNAPAEIRGPFESIQTTLPGVRVSEHFPRLAVRMNRFALVRSLYHLDSPIHETGLQWMQTGRLNASGPTWPHCGAILSRWGSTGGDLPWVILPRPIGNTGVAVRRGQDAGFLGERLGPWFPGSRRRCPTANALNLDAEPRSLRDRYGDHNLGRACLRARRLIERGCRFVTVNMFDTVFGRVTWDCHAHGGDLGSTLADYATTLSPMLDQALSALVDDLSDRGLLERTVIVCLGEFGRTPKINIRGGRDHWPGVWSGLFAGGPIQGGRVIGCSDAIGAEPADRPVHLAQVVATIYRCFGLSPRSTIDTPDGPQPLSVADAIAELF